MERGGLRNPFHSPFMGENTELKLHKYNIADTCVQPNHSS